MYNLRLALIYFYRPEYIGLFDSIFDKGGAGKNEFDTKELYELEDSDEDDDEDELSI